jgi:hypothetical protein
VITREAFIGGVKYYYKKEEPGREKQPTQKKFRSPGANLIFRRYVDSGVLTIKIQVVDCYTFLDYIMGGTEINLMLAIDFTGSNGKPTDPNSLHAIKVGQLNGMSFCSSSFITMVALGLFRPL